MDLFSTYCALVITASFFFVLIFQTLAGGYTFFCGEGNCNDQLGRAFFMHEEIVSAVMRFGIC
jgi:hypothetical protein